MWEFCINLTDENIALSKKIYISLKQFCKQYGGIVTTYERCGCISILVSANKCDAERIKHFVQNLIGDIICEDFKLKYLQENLSLSNLDTVSKNAFLQALLSFDKESDKYVVQKFLELNNSIDVEAFYFFKMSPLREKWKELVQIANDNKAYLSSNETLVELLKFLVDNLEVKNESVNLIKEEGKLFFYDTNFNLLNENNLQDKDIDSTIISKLISYAPKHVNIYCKDSFNSGLINLLKQIFDKRINFVSCDEIEDKK
ncbi:MAG: hypothetical protein E7378_04550 [Clostridiales bacterium]|nr:hypothetical protein [Clostridiales bacterium]